MIGMTIGPALSKLPKNKKDRKRYFGKGDGKPFRKSQAAKDGWRKNNKKPTIGRVLRRATTGGLAGASWRRN